MTELETLVAEIHRLAKGYQPATHITQQLQQITFVPIIGPFEMGKTTVMQAACRLDSDFGMVRSFTTRVQRSNETSSMFDFVPHDVAHLTRLIEQIRQGQLVQFVVHPTTGYIYGSRSEDYDRPYAMLETLPQALTSLSTLPFQKIAKVALVTSPDEWSRRVQARLDKTDLSKRLQEGIANLEWSLDQGANLTWISNYQQSPTSTAVQLVAAVQVNSASSQSNARHMGQQLLAYMKNMQV